MRTKQFWIETFERAVKTAAQAAVLVLIAGSAAVNAFSVAWTDVLGFAVGGGVLSVLTSLASGPVGDVESPSLVAEDPGDEGIGVVEAILVVFLVIVVLVVLFALLRNGLGGK